MRCHKVAARREGRKLHGEYSNCSKLADGVERGNESVEGNDRRLDTSSTSMVR